MTRPVAADRRYAEAAFQVAMAHDALDRWQKDLALAAGVLSQPEVAPYVDSPAVPLADRLGAVDRMLGAHLQPGALRLVNLLVERGRAASLVRVSEEYTRQLNAHRGIVMATVTSATPLDADEVAKVLVRVEAMAGSKVELKTEVDPALIGGLTIKVRDELLDASIRGRLERLSDKLHAGGRLR
jgi:F-type H+-transporting ATPase subunit delta